jgi:hypothetical protein
MSFADQITKDRGQPATVRIGTVLTVSPLVVSVQGSALTNIGALNPGLVVGDVVALLGQSAISSDGSSWLALGPLATSAQVHTDNPAGIQVMTVVQNNATAVYAAITGVTFTFRKLRANSRVVMHFAGSSFASAIGVIGEFALRVVDISGMFPTTDQSVASFFYNLAATHLSWSGTRILAAGTLPAGTYTITGQFRNVGGAGNISFDANDRLSATFTEVG